HLEEAPPGETAALPDRLEVGTTVTAVARQDQVGRELPLGSAPGVHRRYIQDGGRPLDERVGERRGATSGFALDEGFGRDHTILERLEGHPQVPVASVGGIG